jgi:hypothetical protein
MVSEIYYTIMLTQLFSDLWVLNFWKIVLNCLAHIEV